MWFCVSALSVSEHTEDFQLLKERLWEEQVFLISANDARQAQGAPRSFVTMNTTERTLDKAYRLSEAGDHEEASRLIDQVISE